MDEEKIIELLKLKFEYENDNIKLYQKSREILRKKLSNIKNLDMIENDLRKLFNQAKIKRGDLR